MKNKLELTRRRASRVRYKLRKTVLRNSINSQARYRVSVHMSNRYIYAQVIDDDHGTTLAHCSSLDKVFGEKLSKDSGSAAKVGEQLADYILAKNIKTDLVFDKGGRKYGRRLDALAGALRSKGLKI